MSEPKLAYWEWSAPEGADPDDWEAVAGSNPGTEVGRITPEFTAIERAAMTEDEFLRERLGIFPESDDAPRWLVIPEQSWIDTGRGVDGAGWIDAPTFAVEVEPDDTGAVILAAGAVEGGEGIELAVRRDGTGWLVDRLAEMVAKHAPGRPVFVDKGSAADTFTERFEAAGLTVVRVETADVVQAAADIVRGVNAGTVLHRDDDDQAGLTEAVARLVKRTYGDVWLPDRRTGAVVLPFLAASLALWGSRQDTQAGPEPEFIVI